MEPSKPNFFLQSYFLTRNIVSSQAKICDKNSLSPPGIHFFPTSPPPFPKCGTESFLSTVGADTMEINSPKAKEITIFKEMKNEIFQ